MDEKKQKEIEIERQLERSGLFTHTSLSRYAERINEIESFLYGLIDTLLAENKIDKKTLKENVEAVKNEMIHKKEFFHAGVFIRKDVEESHNLEETLNCKDRIHICKAVCCKLSFPLSVSEIESGYMKWDLGQPYINRQGEDGYCVHMNTEALSCNNYKNRSLTCKKYNCKNDKRIWKDFEKKELNNDWIDKNLGDNKLHLEALYMIPD